MPFSTSQVLAKFVGMSRDFLYYLEKAGFIKPTRLVRGKLEKRLYSEEDTEKIDLIWQYYQRGIPPKQAVKKAEAQLASGVSPGEVRLKEALEQAHAEGIKLGAMSLETFLSILSDADDADKEDLSRLIKHLTKKYQKNYETNR